MASTLFGYSGLLTSIFRAFKTTRGSEVPVGPRAVVIARERGKKYDKGEESKMEGSTWWRRRMRRGQDGIELRESK
ncbi:hypothetical protein BDZ89DRAFT_1086270 [Hymenopellis radicata]|nr:hypothetical protein BDZ89DRAFT_1086270 [Hymenopellis radicata]